MASREKARDSSSDLQKQAATADAKPKSAPDDGTSELQARADEAAAKGYFGWTPDPNPNSAYSLASGPNAPSEADTKPKENC